MHINEFFLKLNDMIIVMTWGGGIYTTALFVYTLYLKGNSIAVAAQLKFPLLFPRSKVQSSQPFFLFLTIFNLVVDVDHCNRCPFAIHTAENSSHHPRPSDRVSAGGFSTL
jgi:hypothetical protein